MKGTLPSRGRARLPPKGECVEGLLRWRSRQPAEVSARPSVVGCHEHTPASLVRAPVRTSRRVQLSICAGASRRGHMISSGAGGPLTKRPEAASNGGSDHRVLGLAHSRTRIALGHTAAGTRRPIRAVVRILLDNACPMRHNSCPTAMWPRLRFFFPPSVTRSKIARNWPPDRTAPWAA